MEFLEHVAKVALAMFLLTLVVSIVGGWVLSLLEPGPWDKETIRDVERPVDLVGKRRP